MFFFVLFFADSAKQKLDEPDAHRDLVTQNAKSINIALKTTPLCN